MISKIVQDVNKKVQLQLQKTIIQLQIQKNIVNFQQCRNKIKDNGVTFWIIVCNLMVENHFSIICF